jgi:hypothetical protein
MIHVVGNSHVNTFSNCPFVSRGEVKNDVFKLHHIGALTAKYMLRKYSNKINGVLKHIQKGSHIIPMAGEVDCRFHIPLQATRQKKNDEAMVSEFMKGYMEVFDYLISLGYKPIAFGTHPSTTEDHDMSNIMRPIHSSMERRNGISILWNEQLEQEAYTRNIPFISIYHYLVNGSNKTNMKYYLDYCHLNSSLVFEFILMELKKIGL